MTKPKGEKVNPRVGKTEDVSPKTKTKEVKSKARPITEEVEAETQEGEGREENHSDPGEDEKSIHNSEVDQMEDEEGQDELMNESREEEAEEWQSPRRKTNPYKRPSRDELDNGEEAPEPTRKKSPRKWDDLIPRTTRLPCVTSATDGKGFTEFMALIRHQAKSCKLTEEESLQMAALQLQSQESVQHYSSREELGLIRDLNSFEEEMNLLFVQENQPRAAMRAFLGISQTGTVEQYVK